MSSTVRASRRATVPVDAVGAGVEVGVEVEGVTGASVAVEVGVWVSTC